MNTRVESLIKLKKLFNNSVREIFEELNPEEQNNLIEELKYIDKTTGISSRDEVPESILKEFRKKQNEQPF